MFFSPLARRYSDKDILYCTQIKQSTLLKQTNALFHILTISKKKSLCVKISLGNSAVGYSQATHLCRQSLFSIHQAPTWSSRLCFLCRLCWEHPHGWRSVLEELGASSCSPWHKFQFLPEQIWLFVHAFNQQILILCHGPEATQLKVSPFQKSLPLLTHKCCPTDPK